jgi:hypothetical protein
MVNDTADAELKAIKWDTLKYQKFDYVLIVGLYQQHRNFTNTFQEMINHDTRGLSIQTYNAESKLISGITLSYDKFQLSFGVRSTPQNGSEGKGYTKTFNIGFNFGDNRWLLENYYRSFQGFYNTNTAAFDTNFKNTKQYYLQPGLTSKLFMTRLMYFTNYQNFSFQSGFGCNYRQLKSAATWILGGSFNVYDLHNDSSVFPVQARPLYNDYAGLKSFRSFNFSFNAGAAITIVLFKALFMSGYFTVGPEQQWRNYDLGSSYRHLSYISFSGTGRFAMGVNLRKFYLVYSFTDDYNLYDSFQIMAFKSESITNNFTFGWRFHTGTPKFYKKFQETKIYKLF